jgi:D-inositol-3-phosphate glycosyltransferase
MFANNINAFKRRRIAMLSIHSSPVGPLGARNTGGMSVYVREVSRWVALAGHAVDIFTYMPGPEAPVDLYPRVRLIHLTHSSQKEITKGRLFDHAPVAARRLEQFGRTGQLKYDIIHSHYWLSGVVGTMVQKHWCCPHLVMFHTLGLIKNRTTAAEAEPRLRIDHERKLVAAAQGVVAPTPGERENLICHYGALPENIHTIPCGVNLDRFMPMDQRRARLQLELDPDSDLVFFVGRFVPVKGIDLLIQAVAELLPRFPKLRLLLAGGDGPHADTTKALIDQAVAMAVDQHVTLAGRIRHDELPRYYSAADLLALPSTYESFGLAALEALACGTPVAATAVGGAPSIIVEGLNGTLIKGPTGKDVAKGLERLLLQKRRQPPQPDRIRASIGGFGWDRIAQAVMQSYEGMVQHPPANV